LIVYCGVTQEIIINKTVNSAFYASCRLMYFVHIPAVFYLVHCIFDAYHHWYCEFKSSSGWGVQHYVIKFVSDLWQVCGFPLVLRFPPPIKLTATILLKVALNTINLYLYFYYTRQSFTSSPESEMCLWFVPHNHDCTLHSEGCTTTVENIDRISKPLVSLGYTNR
jgi:hypothetical protein